jgi:hypothetical protein
LIEFIKGERDEVMMMRNKRKGLKLSIVFAPLDYEDPDCPNCFLDRREDCYEACKELEIYTGTRHFWLKR